MRMGTDTHVFTKRIVTDSVRYTVWIHKESNVAAIGFPGLAGMVNPSGLSCVGFLPVWPVVFALFLTDWTQRDWLLRSEVDGYI